jgi:hypothetical protein
MGDCSAPQDFNLFDGLLNMREKLLALTSVNRGTLDVLRGPVPAKAEPKPPIASIGKCHFSLL